MDMDTGVVSTGAVAAPPDPLKNARDALNKLLVDVDRAIAVRDKLDRRSEQYADADADVKRAQAAARDTEARLKQRERALAPLFDAQRRAIAAGEDPAALLQAIDSLLTFFKKRVGAEEHDDAELALSSMKTTLSGVIEAEAKRARQTAAARAQQMAAIDKLMAETKDVVSRKAAADREVAKLKAAVASAEKKLEKEDNDVENATAALERALTPPAPPLAPPAPSPKPAPKPATRPGVLRRLSTRESIVDQVMGPAY